MLLLKLVGFVEIKKNSIDTLQTVIPFLWVKVDIYFILTLEADLEVFSSYISRLLRRLISTIAELWQTLDTNKCETIFIPYQRVTELSQFKTLPHV